jgi:hypothetical protein
MSSIVNLAGHHIEECEQVLDQNLHFKYYINTKKKKEENKNGYGKVGGQR